MSVEKKYGWEEQLMSKPRTGKAADNFKSHDKSFLCKYHRKRNYRASCSHGLFTPDNQSTKLKSGGGGAAAVTWPVSK